jgi:hypothetical protein
MLKQILPIACVLAWSMACPVGEICAQQADEVANNWHQWRGPQANGVSRTAKPPLRWNENKNIKKKVKIDGNGSSTPII